MKDFGSRCKELIQISISMINYYPGPTFLEKHHPSRNTAAFFVLAGYSEIKLRSSAGGNNSLQCFWVSSSSWEQDGASLSCYAPRMSGSCNGAKSSHDHVDSMLHLRDMVEHREKPNPSSQGEQRRGEHAPCRNSL